MNKILLAALLKFCTSGGDALFHICNDSYSSLVISKICEDKIYIKVSEEFIHLSFERKESKYSYTETQIYEDC